MKNKYTTVKKVTLPLIKFIVGETIAILCIGTIFTGKEIKGTDAKAKMEPANLMNVVDLETGEESQIIISTVLGGILDDNYPEASYVDKCFLLTKGEKLKGKQYFPYSVTEIEKPKETK